jgi:hypothetical protein
LTDPVLGGTITSVRESSRRKAEEPLWALVCDLGPSERNERLIVALQAYIDDSGSNVRDETFALAGFISSIEDWAQFSKEWQAVLDQSPCIAYFKMSEAFSRVKEFNEDRFPTKQSVEQRVLDFVHVIRSHGVIRVHCTMHRDDYDAEVKGKADTRVDTIYFPCFYQVIFSVMKFYERNKTGQKVDFIFDHQGKIGTDTGKVVSGLQKCLSC